MDAYVHLIFALFKMETAVIIIRANRACLGLLLRSCSSTAILLQDLSLGRSDQLVFLFSLSFLRYLSDAGMRVKDWCVLHGTCVSLPPFYFDILNLYLTAQKL